jgi:hypothetical protein
MEPAIGQALSGDRLNPVTLRWFTEAFRMSAFHTRRLESMLNGDELGSGRIPPIVIGSTRQRDADSSKRHYDVLAVLERHELDHRGIPRRHRTFQVLRSTQDELLSYPYVFDTAEADVRVIRGGTMSAPKTYGRDGLLRVDFVFPEPVLAGELVAFEFESVFHYAERPDPDFARKCERKDRVVDMAVQFDPNSRPESVHWFRMDLDGTNRDEVEVELDDELSVHGLMELVSNAYVGFQWSFGTD